jgi:hypothetical protein
MAATGIASRSALQPCGQVSPATDGCREDCLTPTVVLESQKTKNYRKMWKRRKDWDIHPTKQGGYLELSQ